VNKYNAITHSKNKASTYSQKEKKGPITTNAIFIGTTECRYLEQATHNSKMMADLSIRFHTIWGIRINLAMLGRRHEHK
jgi:hypothetical protein